MGKQYWGIGALVVLSGCNAALEDPTPPSFDAGGSGGFFNGPVPIAGTSPGVVGVAGGGFQAPLPGAVFTAAQQPQPVTGGTLLVLKDETTAIVADPDRDQVLVVDLAAMSVKHKLALDPLSDPGRAVEDSAGNVHVVLRARGQLFTFNPTTGESLGSRDVCAYPRGLAIDEASQLVHVACAEGRLVSLSTTATVTEASRDVKLDRDLRDVVLAPDGLWVSRFRSAEVLRLDAAGVLKARITLPPLTDGGSTTLRVPTVAWRMVSNGAGGVVLVHQRSSVAEVVPSPGGYGGLGSGGIVESAVSEVSSTNVATTSNTMLGAPLPVDIARSSVSGHLLLASAANEHPVSPGFATRTRLVHPSSLLLSPTPALSFDIAASDSNFEASTPRGSLVAVAFAGSTPVLQFREPSSLQFGARGLVLPGDSIVDTASKVFHLETSSGLACASCHPEGQDDGHVWNFQGFGPRRTQSLRGGLLGTEPFHWDGQEKDFTALSNDVMSGRMGGPQLTTEQIDALAHYVDRFAPLPAPSSASTPQVERGKALFNDAKVGCATCHNATRFNNQLADIGGANGPMQVPTLDGLWARAPYLHDGCAKTLADRFSTSCGTKLHGNVDSLSVDDVTALTAYLETL